MNYTNHRELTICCNEDLLVYKKTLQHIQKQPGLWIPRAWRNIRVIFIPKLGKIVQGTAKSLKLIRLISFELKTLDTLLIYLLEMGYWFKDQQTWTNTPVVQENQQDREQGGEHTEGHVRSFLENRGSIWQYICRLYSQNSETWGIENTCVTWIDPMLREKNTSNDYGRNNSSPDCEEMSTGRSTVSIPVKPIYGHCI